jgi:hypothetical protein
LPYWMEVGEDAIPISPHRCPNMNWYLSPLIDSKWQFYLHPNNKFDIVTHFQYQSTLESFRVMYPHLWICDIIKM